jgi:hypothetical protein
MKNVVNICLKIRRLFWLIEYLFMEALTCLYSLSDNKKDLAIAGNILFVLSTYNSIILRQGRQWQWYRFKGNLL